MTPSRDLSRRLAIVDRLRTEGWSTYTRVMPARLADAFGRPVSRAIAAAWMRWLADDEGLELLPSTMTISEQDSGNVRISVLARPAQPLDPDPLEIELLELDEPRPPIGPPDRSAWVVVAIVAGILALAAVIVLVTAYG